MLEKVKVALRITTDVFDEELNDLIESAYRDLDIAGINIVSTEDSSIVMAVKTYCKLNWGHTDDYDRLKASYDEQKRQLSMAREYRMRGGCCE